MNKQVEWSRLGTRLERLSPDKFAEILDALRETVGFHEVLAAGGLRVIASGKAEPA